MDSYSDVMNTNIDELIQNQNSNDNDQQQQRRGSEKTDTEVGAGEQQAAPRLHPGGVDKSDARNNGNDKTGDRSVSGISIGTEKWVLKHPTTAVTKMCVITL